MPPSKKPERIVHTLPLGRIRGIAPPISQATGNQPDQTRGPRVAIPTAQPTIIDLTQEENDKTSYTPNYPNCINMVPNHPSCTNGVLPYRYIYPSPVESLLGSLDGFDEDLLKVLRQIALEHLGDISEKCRHVWNSSTTSHPRLFPVESCWTKVPPSPSDLLIATLNFLGKGRDRKVATFRRGERDAAVDSRRTITQLHDPDKFSPVSLIGLRLSEMPKETLKCPEATSEFVDPSEESGHMLLLTPKFCHTDLHLGKS
ncbi:hypothetical protein B0J14DRAFT_574353 [Halenospora varia]|nr:hypothetical protein B0J14DRAFT_574353 [Halenospora varia]